MALEDYFSFQVFLIVLRETLELAIIVSVLLAFLHQSFVTPKSSHIGYTRLSSDEQSSEDIETSSSNGAGDNVEDKTLDNTALYKYLRLQVWVGGLLGLICCLLIGTVILSIFYIIGKDLWSVAEHYWEGAFSIIASLIISIMGIKVLRVNKMQEKWKAKLTTLVKDSRYIDRAMKHEQRSSTSFSDTLGNFSDKYSMFILPFVTTLREGMEAIVFIGGIGINENTSISSIITSVTTAIIIGSGIGIILYRTGNSLSLQWFMVVSTCFLYLIAAGLFSKGVWNFELQRFIDLCDGFDVSETGHGPGSYDITNSVWHVNCCNGEIQDDGAFWMIVTAVLGWTNSATYGSVISYICYWICIIVMFWSLLFEEKHGYLPLIPLRLQQRRIKKRLLLAKLHQNTNRSSIDSTTPLTEN